MRYYLNTESDDFTFEIEKLNDFYKVKFQDNSYELKTKKVGAEYFYSIDNLNWKKITLKSSFEKSYLGSEELKVYKGFKPASSASGDAGSLVTQMPGKIVKVLVNEGDQVKAGDTLIILEAMKMENEIKCKVDGEVISILAKEGQSVDTGFTMLELNTQP